MLQDRACLFLCCMSGDVSFRLSFDLLLTKAAIALYVHSTNVNASSWRYDRMVSILNDDQTSQQVSPMILDVSWWGGVRPRACQPIYRVFEGWESRQMQNPIVPRMK
jgi:hypothetical protein